MLVLLVLHKIMGRYVAKKDSWRHILLLYFSFRFPKFIRIAIFDLSQVYDYSDSPIPLENGTVEILNVISNFFGQ